MSTQIIAEAPPEHTIDGVRYIRADLVQQPQPSDFEESYLTVAQASEATGISASTIYVAIARGDLKATKPNGMKRGQRVRLSELHRWMNG